MSAKMMNQWEFLGGSVVRTWCFQCQGLGLIHGWGSKSPQVSWYSKKKEKVEPPPKKKVAQESLKYHLSIKTLAKIVRIKCFKNIKISQRLAAIQVHL